MLIKTKWVHFCYKFALIAQIIHYLTGDVKKRCAKWNFSASSVWIVKHLLCFFLFQTETIRVVLKKELNLPIIEMSDTKAKLEGGDVLFTGGYLFLFFSFKSDWFNICLSVLKTFSSSFLKWNRMKQFGKGIITRQLFKTKLEINLLIVLFCKIFTKMIMLSLITYVHLSTFYFVNQ